MNILKYSMVTEVIKRDNTKEVYNVKKITNVLNLAFQNSNTICNDIGYIVGEITNEIDSYESIDNTIHIENIQNIVEKKLMKCRYYDTAKHYIEYRRNRQEYRNVDSYISKIPDDVITPWGMLGYITYKRTYARLLKEESEDGTTEEYCNTIKRILTASQKQLGVGFTNEELKKAYYYLMSLKCSVAGRFAWQLGTKTVDNLGIMSLQNCAFVKIDEPIKPFLWIFDVLMLGTGVGFSIEKKYVEQLPPIVDTYIKITRMDTKDADFIVPDSREGWVSLLEKVFEAYFYKGKSFTYSTVLIRGAGSKIKGFGGVASGPEDLVKGLDNVQKILSSRKGSKLTTVDCLDIVNIIATVVVAGNVRRCLPKDSMVHTKNGLVKIQDINVGDAVLTSVGYENVKNVFVQGKQNVITIHTKDGDFECTPNHKMAVMKSPSEYVWKMAKDLKYGDLLMTPRRAIDGIDTRLPESDEIVVPELYHDVAWFIGIIHSKLSNIDSTKDKILSYKFKKTEDNHNIVMKMKKILFSFYDMYNQSLRLDIELIDDHYYISFVCTEIYNYFKKHIIDVVDIPEFIYKTTFTNRMAYISGVIDANDHTESYFSYRNVFNVFYAGSNRGDSSMLEYSKQLQILCYSCGFETKRTNKDGVHKLDIVTSYAAECILETPSLVKRNIIASYVGKGMKNTNSYPVHLLKKTKRFDIVDKKIGLIYNHCISVDSYEEYFENVMCCPNKVVKVDYDNIKCVETFDIEVNNRHEFYCNGLLTHNSALIALGDCDDIPYLKAKDWSTGNIPNWRCMSNNSVVCDDVTKLPNEFWEGYNGTSEPYGLINLELSRKIGRIKDGGKYPDPDVVGYNPCFSGETLIAVADGRGAVTIKQLSEEGKDIPVYSINEEGIVEIKWGRNPRITGENQRIVKVILDDGTFVKTTLNHKFRLRDGTIVFAKDLKPRMSLPRLTKSHVDATSNGVSHIYVNTDTNNSKNGKCFEHILIADFYDKYNTSDLETFTNNGILHANKDCEQCNNKFMVPFTSREVAYCSLSCNNSSTSACENRRKSKSSIKNKQETILHNQIMIFKNLQEEFGKVPMKKDWENRCKKEGVSYRIRGKNCDNEYILCSYQDLKDRAIDYNHRVRSIEFLDETETVYNITVDDNHTVGIFTTFKNHIGNGIFTPQCGEQSLSNFETCCLSEIYLSNVSSLEELKDIATTVYRICKHSLALKCHQEETEKIVHKNMRMGIGITGYMQASDEQKSWLDPLYEYIREYDNMYSDKHGFPRSIKLTTVKPSGTLSLLAGVTSGCHPAIYQYFIRRIRIASNNSLIQLCKSKGYYVEYQKNFDGTDDKNTMVVEFPCCYPIGSRLARDMSVIDQLEVVKHLQTYWSDNSVSCTVYYRLDELDIMKDWLKNNFTNCVKSCSFLLHNEHGFQQAPFEEITKEKYDELMKNVVPITCASINIEQMPDYSSECVGGVCPIR